jgi:hypothetical protein
LFRESEEATRGGQGRQGSTAAMSMNWAVAESAAFRGGACECDEREAEEAAFAEYQRRTAAEAKAEPVHKNSAAAMAAEHKGMREREKARRKEKIERERRENEESARALALKFGLNDDLESDILGRVGEPSGTRTFEYSHTQHAALSKEHLRREQVRTGVLALEKRCVGYVNEVASGSAITDASKWQQLPAAPSAPDPSWETSNARLHGMEDKEFIQMFRS